MQQSGHNTVLQKQSDPSEALLPIYNQDALKSLDTIIISNKPFQWQVTGEIVCKKERKGES
jgi:hypothetical protein